MTSFSWASATDSLACARNINEFEARLFAVADDLAPELIGMGVSIRAWRPLGIRVTEKDLGDVSGLCGYRDGFHFIAVNRRDDPRRQKFTVAHEIGHLLMGVASRRQIGVTRKTEELLADAFAVRLIVPPGDLSDFLAPLGRDISDVLLVCARYGVSISVALAAIGDWLALVDVAMFGASRRPHPSRPSEIALRTHQARCRDIFIPDLVRLESIGLGAIPDLSHARPSELCHGASENVELQLWRPGGSPRSGTLRGPAEWQAKTLRNGITLVRIDTARLETSWWGERQAIPRAA
jgi:hypothetical protein